MGRDPARLLDSDHGTSLAIITTPHNAVPTPPPLQAHADKQSNDFFVFGESYGGHYVPSATYKIFTRNQALQPGEVSVNLKGLGIGNGLTEPLVQYQYYGQMAYNYSIEKLGHPVLPLSTYQEMQSELPSCTTQIAACQNDTSQCAGAMEFCNSVLVEPYEQTGLSPYDFRKTCDYPPL
jgi:cathepsin A (carboxypeptidase C)